jgi:pimeloyl-ACP methyl ester carboxylesterase
MTMLYEEKYFESEYDKLRYFQVGFGNAILFLHGSWVNALTYKKILDLLSKKYLVIAPDLPCFGKSTCPNNASEYFKILEKFITFLNFKKIAIIGHSLGAVMALHLSSNIKNNPLLVVVDSVGISQKISKAKFLQKFFIEKTIRDIFLYRNLLMFLRIAKDFLKNLSIKFFEWKQKSQMIEEFLTSDFASFNKIRAKTLILWGEQDEVFSKDIAENFHKKIKGSELKFTTGNHNWCLYNSEKFSDIVIDWLKTNNY